MNRSDNWSPRMIEGWNPKLPAFVWWHKGQPDAEKIYLWRNKIIKLWLMDSRKGEPEFIVAGQGSGKPIIVYKNGEEHARFYNNSIEAWFEIKNSFDETWD